MKKLEKIKNKDVYKRQAQNVEAAGKSLKVSEKAFFKEMKEFDYKGMNRYVKDWGEGGQFVSAFYMVPSRSLIHISSVCEV